MPASILTALAAAFQAVASFFGWKGQKDLLNAGRASATADALQKKDEANAQALQAREAVRGDLALHPDSIMQSDEFRRD